MHFSLALTPYKRFPDHRQLLATVGLVERLGFRSVNLGDHVAVEHEPPGKETVQSLYYDPLILASSILSRYSTIRAALNVLVLPYYQPVRLAKSLATLDTLSEGRLSVGLGVGWLRSEFQAMGVAFEQRGAITEEYIRAMQALWRDSPATFEGSHVSFRNVVSEPGPHRGSQPDLWIGAGPSTKGIERAARVGADGITFMTRPRDTMERHLELARTLLSESGRDVDGFPFAYAADYGTQSAVMLAHYLRDNSVPHEVLSSEPEQAMEQIADYERMGFTHLFLRFSAHGYEEFEEQASRFAEKIMHPLRGE